MDAHSEDEKTPVLSDAGAVVEQTKGTPRARFVDNPPGPLPLLNWP